MTTLSNRIDSVATHILTAKQDLRQAILDKKGTVRENPTFEELKKGIEGISTGTIINYEEYIPSVDEICKFMIGPQNLNIKEIRAHMFYLHSENSIWYIIRDSSTYVKKYNLSTKTITHFMNGVSDSTYSTKNIVNLIPYDENDYQTIFKFYYNVGNLCGSATYKGGALGGKYLYQWDFITKTTTTLFSNGVTNSVLFNYLEDLGNLYYLRIKNAIYLYKWNKSTSTNTQLQMEWLGSNTSSDNIWTYATCLVNPYVTDNVYWMSQGKDDSSKTVSLYGFFKLSTNTSTTSSNSYPYFSQTPIPILEKGRAWGGAISNLGKYCDLEDTTKVFYPTPYSTSDTMAENCRILVPIWNFPFFYDLLNNRDIEGGYYTLPIDDRKTCECYFNQLVFKVKKNFYAGMSFDDINQIISPNTIFQTQAGYKYLICRSPITGYIKYI